MPNLIRMQVDLSQGHCYPPAPCTLGGSPDVLANGFPVARLTDIYNQIHVCGDDEHFMGLAITGSDTVFINGLPAHRAGDSIQCGDFAANGSLDVILDDGG